jgi:hypothetical protein
MFQQTCGSSSPKVCPVVVKTSCRRLITVIKFFIPSFVLILAKQFSLDQNFSWVFNVLRLCYQNAIMKCETTTWMNWVFQIKYSVLLICKIWFSHTKYVLQQIDNITILNTIKGFLPPLFDYWLKICKTYFCWLFLFILRIPLVCYFHWHLTILLISTH